MQCKVTEFMSGFITFYWHFRLFNDVHLYMMGDHFAYTKTSLSICFFVFFLSVGLNSNKAATQQHTNDCFLLLFFFPSGRKRVSYICCCFIQAAPASTADTKFDKTPLRSTNTVTKPYKTTKTKKQNRKWKEIGFCQQRVVCLSWGGSNSSNRTLFTDWVPQSPHREPTIPAFRRAGRLLRVCRPRKTARSPRISLLYDGREGRGLWGGGSKRKKERKKINKLWQPPHELEPARTGRCCSDSAVVQVIIFYLAVIGQVLMTSHEETEWEGHSAASAPQPPLPFYTPRWS